MREACRDGKAAIPDAAAYSGDPASGAAKDATKPVMVVFAGRRSGPRSVLRASDPAKGIEGGGGRDKKALQQKREERDHADRDALYTWPLAKPFHLTMIHR
ncbi:MAG: hypothetical protein DLM68_02935 [Hyphomicrobiales bacterium]|nr:MAG: hypothetical protein DLM68_02935 [Hyphomicrobiales bacterium]